MRSHITDHFESNKTAAALARESERELAANPILPVDLRTIPREQWDSCLDHELVLPPRLLDGFDPGPLPRESVGALEEAVEKFHGITAPYYARISFDLVETGRAWKYVAEAAPYLTGFTLEKET